MNLGISGKTALVTGASEGIGAAVVRGLVAEGVTVHAAARRVGPLRDLMASLVGLGPGSVIVTSADTTDPEDVERLVAEVGTVDILVNNVGGSSTKHIFELSMEEWREAFDRNLFSAVRLTSALVPAMIGRRWGRIVHVGSVAAREPGSYAAAYGAAKAALLAYSKALSTASARHGVLSTVVLPGPTLTEAFHAEIAIQSRRAAVGPEEATRIIMGSRQPSIRRPASPDEVAAAIVFLCSDVASAVTGSTVAVDGGSLVGVW